MIAFLGMGLLGSNFTRALLKKGNEVNVWNRTHSRALPLAEAGAVVYENVVDAVTGADRIHITLKDDAAVNEVLQLALPGLKPGATIIDHTTTSAEGADYRTTYWKSMGLTYLHAPVFMGPQNALESTGYMLVSGDEDVVAQWEPELAKMTGRVLNFGTTVNRAAGMKLIGNLFLIAITGGLADALGLAKGLNIPVSDVSTLFDAWNPGMMLPVRLKKMTSDTFHQPTWELAMSRKDAGLMMQEATNADIQLTVVPAVAALMDQYIERGFGHHDWTVIGKDNVPG